MIAPRNALAKPFTSKLGTSAAASIIINALITRANKPNVNTDNGAVKNQSAGRINALIKPSTAAVIRKARKLFAFIPGISNVAKAKPTAVANHVISKAVILPYLIV